MALRRSPGRRGCPRDRSDRRSSGGIETFPTFPRSGGSRVGSAPSDHTYERELNMHENAETVRRGYEAFNTADMHTLTELFDEKASWHTPGHSPIAGNHVGRDAAFPSSAATRETPAEPSRRNCVSCTPMTRVGRSVSITTARKRKASGSTSTAASSSRSRTAGSPTGGSTSTTSTPGTISGHSPSASD